MSELESLFKKMLHAGIDAVTSVGEKAQKEEEEIVEAIDIDELNAREDKEQIDIQEEGKKLVSNFIEEAKNKRVTLEEKLGLHVSSLLNKMDLLTRSELEELEERVSNLEKKAGIDLKISFLEEEE